MDKSVCWISLGRFFQREHARVLQENICPKGIVLVGSVSEIGIFDANRWVSRAPKSVRENFTRIFFINRAAVFILGLFDVTLDVCSIHSGCRKWDIPWSEMYFSASAT